MTRVKQLALDADAEFTAGSPFSITFTPDATHVFTLPTVSYKTKGGDVVTGTAVPAATTDGTTLTLTWSPTCSAANNTNTNTRGLQYRFEVQAKVDGEGPFPIFGGENIVWPTGVATGPGATSAITGTINLGGIAITGTLNLAGPANSGQIDGGSAASVYGGTTSIDGGSA